MTGMLLFILLHITFCVQTPNKLNINLLLFKHDQNHHRWCSTSSTQRFERATFV